MPTNIDPATTIADLDTDIMQGSVQMRYVDDNLRALKAVLKYCLPSIDGPVTASHIELSYVDGVTGPIQAQIDAKASIAGGAAWSGTQDFRNATVKVATGAAFEGGDEAASQAYVDEFYDRVTRGSQGTSITSIALTTGRKNLVTEPDKSFYPGQPVRLFYDENNYADGQVVTYDSTTGAMVYAAQTITGAGTYAVWSLGPAVLAGINDTALQAGFFFGIAGSYFS